MLRSPGKDYDAVLLISFGGPASMEEVRPFLANVLRGRPAPPQRVEEVVRHYERIGGRSPLTDATLRQAAALEARLRRDGPALPVRVGMRNWHPYIRNTLAELREAGARRVLGFILAVQQSEASWGRYKGDVAAACDSLGDRAPQVDFVGGWHAHPLFIDAVAAHAAAAMQRVAPARRPAARLVFTAHSIPAAMAEQSAYSAQFDEGAHLVAERLGRADYLLAYQSRSGNPRDRWLEPDIRDVVRAAAARGTRDLLVVPLGFSCDHLEVLYDLDIEARAVADGVGVNLVRARTVGDHPSFIEMIAAVLREHVAQH